MSKQQKIIRIFHTWEKWECYRAGFYENNHPVMDRQQCEMSYKDFLGNSELFEKALFRVINEWKYSCEHYLTNEKMNRIAWLGQASCCIELGIPSCFRAGYFKLNEIKRSEADKLALKYLNKWLELNGYESVDIIRAGVNSHADIY